MRAVGARGAKTTGAKRWASRPVPAPNARFTKCRMNECLVVPRSSHAFPSAKGAFHHSPGQRPGNPASRSRQALKARFFSDAMKIVETRLQRSIVCKIDLSLHEPANRILPSEAGEAGEITVTGAENESVLDVMPHAGDIDETIIKERLTGEPCVLSEILTVFMKSRFGPNWIENLKCHSFNVLTQPWQDWRVLCYLWKI
jgi:hypothetical protein